jgi:hypothetical protein
LINVLFVELVNININENENVQVVGIKKGLKILKEKKLF